ncbi:MAG: DUF2076 domain-containing protein [Methylococcaceae bacterium]|jgi:hypothetical protein
MQTQEREILAAFLNQLSNAQAGNKNPEAEVMIQQALAKQPDAAYLLVQRAILMNQALDNLKAQNADLQRQLAARNNNSFLGGNDPWATAPAQNPNRNPSQVPGSGTYQMPQQAQAAASSSGVPSFLGSMATTAAGVVAGSFLFQGIENLMGHHGYNQGGGWPNANNGMDPIAEQTTINNYYGSDNQSASNDNDPSSDFLTSSDDDYFSDSGSDQDSW